MMSLGAQSKATRILRRTSVVAFSQRPSFAMDAALMPLSFEVPIFFMFLSMSNF